jgi:hypothetical protein
MSPNDIARVLAEATAAQGADARRMNVVVRHAYDDGERTYTTKPRRFRSVDAARRYARGLLAEHGGTVEIDDNGAAVAL